MSSRRIGSVIGGVFGLIYILANAGSVPAGAAWTARGVGVLAFAGLVVALRRRPRAHGADADADAGAGDDADDNDNDNDNDNEVANPFGQRGYRLIVAAEVIALVAGSAVLRGPVHGSRAVIGWVSFVVGVHFIGLARLWHARFFDVLGGAIALCGAAGMIAAGAHASTATIAIVAGLLPGAILLGSGYFGALARTPA